jgi:hypothetical protein
MKMLEKLTTHDIQDVAELFSLADECARATEGHTWHTPPAHMWGRPASLMRVPRLRVWQQKQERQEE